MSDTEIVSGAPEVVRSWGTGMHNKKKTRGMYAKGMKGGDEDEAKQSMPPWMRGGGKKRKSMKTPMGRMKKGD